MCRVVSLLLALDSDMAHNVGLVRVELEVWCAILLNENRLALRLLVAAILESGESFRRPGRQGVTIKVTTPSPLKRKGCLWFAVPRLGSGSNLKLHFQIWRSEL